MGNISNRFYVTALEDGTTLHGNLAVLGSVTQAWNGTTAVPDWSEPDQSSPNPSSPTIYLTLLSGGDAVQPDAGFKWYYNGEEIVFDSTTHKSTLPTSVQDKFLQTTNTIYEKAMPAIKIIGNLATSGNVDIDMIMFKGAYTINGSPVDFSCEQQIRISRMTSNGYLGVVDFVNGVSDITTPNQNITLWAKLFGGADGTETATSGYTVDWYVNDVLITAAAGQYTTGLTNYTPTGGTSHSALQINEKDVTDHSIVTCVFKKGADIVYTAYVGVDDMQDPQFMYIQYNGNNGNAASLRKGETVRFFIWVGRRENSNVDTSFAYFKVKLLDGNGNIITDTVSGWPSAGAGGWRTISNREDNKAYIDITYAQANTYFKNITGIIMASTSSFT